MFSSATSGSSEFVKLNPLFTTWKSPVLNAPEPAYVLEVDFGVVLKLSPKFTTPPALFILTGPTIEGIIEHPLSCYKV